MSDSFCPRCKTPMIEMHREETEYWTVGYLLKIIDTCECPRCGVHWAFTTPFHIIQKALPPI